MVEIAAILLRQRLRAPFAVADDVNRFAGGQQLAGLVMEDLVTERNGAALGRRHSRADAQRIVIAGRAAVAAFGFGDDGETVILKFHAAVVEAALPQIFDAPNFKINEIVRVIDDAHLVRLGVADAHHRVYEFAHREGNCSRRAARSGVDGRYLPLQWGGRFRRKDSRPSRKSCVARISALPAAASSSSRLISGAAKSQSSFLVMCRLTGLHVSKSAARICAAIVNSFAGTIWVTSPRRCASAASMIFPVRSRSRARFSPIWRMRKTETTAGRKPMRTSGYPNFASGTAMVKSHIVARPQPPAIAGPFTAAMVGLGKLQIRRKRRARRSASSRCSTGDCDASAFKASRSMPEQNALPAPVRIKTRAGLASTSSKAERSSTIISGEIALRFSGRLSVIMAMSPVNSRWSALNGI